MTPDEQAVLHHIQSIATLMSLVPRKIKSMEQLILDHGQFWAPKPYSGPRGIPKQCFMNATNLVLRDSRLTYVEGYAMGKAIIPILHAWCVNHQGEVIDSTWDDTGSIVYLGIPFKTSYLNETILKAGYYGLLDCYQLHWPLQQGLPTKEWLSGRRYKFARPLIH